MAVVNWKWTELPLLQTIVQRTAQRQTAATVRSMPRFRAASCFRQTPALALFPYESVQDALGIVDTDSIAALLA